MKEKNTNKAGRAFLDVYPGETHPQEAEPSEQVAHAESALTPKRISANAWHAVITRNIQGLYRSVTTVMQDVSLFPQTALAPPASQPEGEGRNHIRSHRPQP